MIDCPMKFSREGNFLLRENLFAYSWNEWTDYLKYCLSTFVSFFFLNPCAITLHTITVLQPFLREDSSSWLNRIRKTSMARKAFQKCIRLSVFSHGRVWTGKFSSSNARAAVRHGKDRWCAHCS